MEAAAALVENNLPVADARLRAHLRSHPTDVAALRMLAEVAGRLRLYKDAQDLLERCLELAPSFDAARHNYAVVLNRQSKPAGGAAAGAAAARQGTSQSQLLEPQAAILANLGDYADSIQVYETVLTEYPRQPKVWMSYGHALEDGRRVRRKRSCVPARDRYGAELGEAYWSLANLKTFRFSDADMLAIAQALGANRSLGRGSPAFRIRARQGVRGREVLRRVLRPLRRGQCDPQSDCIRITRMRDTRYVDRCKAQYTSEFFAARAGTGAPSAGARSSSLGCRERVPRCSSRFLQVTRWSRVRWNCPIFRNSCASSPDTRFATASRGGAFFDAVAALDAASCGASASGISSPRAMHRKTDAPFFVDKMPNNCLYVGFIHLILPNAKIIDARRHPLGCCFSGFKQQFARGQNFSYDLARYRSILSRLCRAHGACRCGVAGSRASGVL